MQAVNLHHLPDRAQIQPDFLFVEFFCCTSRRGHTVVQILLGLLGSAALGCRVAAALCNGLLCRAQGLAHVEQIPCDPRDTGDGGYNVPGQVSSGSVTMQDSHIVEFTSSGSNIKGEVPTLAVGVADASGTALNWLLRRDANAGQNAIYPVLCSWNGSGLDYVGISDYYVGYAPYHDAAMTEDNYIHVVLCDGSSETTYMNGPTTTTSVRTDASTSLAIPSGQASITVTHVNGVEVIVIVSVANGSPQITFGVYQGAGKVSWQPTVPTGITTPKAATTLSVRNKADSQVGLVVNTSAGFSALLINLSA